MLHMNHFKQLVFIGGALVNKKQSSDWNLRIGSGNNDPPLPYTYLTNK